MSSIQGDIDRSVIESSCPYQSVASSRSASSSPRRKQKPRDDPYYPNRPSFLTQLIQTVFVLAGVGFFGFFLTNKTHQSAKAFAQFLKDFVASFPQYLRECEEILLDRWNSIDWTWFTRKPEFWWDTEKVDWDRISKANFWVAVVTLNFYKREVEYLLDPIPRGSGALNGRFLFSTPILEIVTWEGRCPRGLYSPLETVDGKVFPPKAVLVVTAHLRLICFVNRSNYIFNAIIGWWLRRFLEAAVMYEFTLPFKDDFSPYVAFLMSEFGPVFPMGHGLGFGSYKHVKSIIENPDQRKSGLSLAWSISSAQHHWSKNLLTSLPEKENEKSVVAQGRQIVWSWLADVNTRLKDPIVRKRLDALLPFANLDGSMVDKTLIETAFGSTLFHLLIGGDFTKFERKRYHKLLTNAFPFMSDFINKTWFGGILEYKGVRDYDVMRRAFLRYPEADPLQRALATLGRLEPSRGEAMRLQRGVPLVNFMAHDFELPDGVEYVTIFDKRIPVPNGTPLHCSIQNANRDVSVFGTDAGKLNFQRDPDKLKQMLTFNGNINRRGRVSISRRDAVQATRMQ
ncbi:hypothetical protein IV203_032570 [Nitzschia inconspicua]|uniref:Uncharacterized protein n=1 Tax=Nitzschia inconspicua TaxID=303405 RepID=A0A9K3KKZ0_9STRA|nr:hypothetical protein IV203_032570 [Nitzschia inconspicua]